VLVACKKENADYLIEAIREAILFNDAIKQSASKFGIKYTVDFDFTFENKTARIRTGWIVENEDNIPGLITCYIKL
jgi:hypothetical protein